MPEELMEMLEQVVRKTAHDKATDMLNNPDGTTRDKCLASLFLVSEFSKFTADDLRQGTLTEEQMLSIVDVTKRYLADVNGIMSVTVNSEDIL